jgi:protein-disulfide isomerase
MASRKEQKEQARAQRLSKEQADSERLQRTRRLQIFGGAITATVVVIVIAILVSSSGSSPTTGLLSRKSASALYTTVKAEIGGIPQSATTLGDPSAKVTLNYWGDLQCPVCRDFTLGDAGGGLPEFIQRDVRTHIAKVHYLSLCTATCNPADPTGGTSVFDTQQSAAYAAGKQNLAWYYIELFYRQQGAEDSGYVTRSFIDGIAEQIPKLSLTTWQTDAGSKSLVDQVNADQSLAESQYRFNATPSLTISGPKGTASLGSAVLTYAQLAQAVKAVS